MPEFLRLVSPGDALEIFLRTLPDPQPAAEWIDTLDALGRVTTEPIVAPHPLPAFSRSAMDGYAVKSADLVGASQSKPVVLKLTQAEQIDIKQAKQVGCQACPFPMCPDNSLLQVKMNRTGMETVIAFPGYQVTNAVHQFLGGERQG